MTNLMTALPKPSASLEGRGVPCGAFEQKAPRHHVNFLRFDLASMQLVVACADWGSLSVAVKHLHCSLSTGSYRLSGMEDALQTQIFLRDHKGLRVTTQGEQIIAHCRSILLHVEKMQKISEPSTHMAIDIRQ